MMPPMVPSEDTEDLHGGLMDHVRSSGERDALAYLLRYETLVRQQEAAWVAALSHLEPCILRLTQEEDHNDLWTRTVSYPQLREALQIIEQRESHEEHMKTDRQWMMVLRLLMQKAPSSDATSITWAELVQAYQVCVTGMMTLQLVPEPTAARTRVRDRTMSMLSLFEPPSTQLFDEQVGVELPTAFPAPVTAPQRRRRAPKGKAKRRLSVALVLAMIGAIFGYLKMSSTIKNVAMDEGPTKQVMSVMLAEEEDNDQTTSNLSIFSKAATVSKAIANPLPVKRSPVVAVVTSPALIGVVAGMTAAPYLAPLMAANNILTSVLFTVGITTFGRLFLDRLRQMILPSK